MIRWLDNGIDYFVRFLTTMTPARFAALLAMGAISFLFLWRPAMPDLAMSAIDVAQFTMAVAAPGLIVVAWQSHRAKRPVS